MEPKDKERVINDWLDAALRQHGVAGPRPGLENRVMAAVKAERERVPAQSWTWWPVGVAVAASLLVGISMFLRIARDEVSPTSVAHHVAAPAVSKAPERRVTAVVRKPRARLMRRSIPRQEQFPSPQPLSEQEKILARYIEQFPREAGLVAQAQTQLSKQEMIEQETSEQNQ